MSDPYSVLGIEGGSSTEQVKRAYRKLSLEHHPDRNNGSAESTEKFQNITEAYEKLTNPAQQLAQQLAQQRAQKFNNYFTKRELTPEVNSELTSELTPEEFIRMFARGGFTNIFNSSELHARMHKPVPIVKNITISFQQAFTGCSIPLDIERWILDGNVRKQEIETIYVHIPEGVDSNEIFICRGKGNMIDPSNIGDVKVFVKVEPVTGFERRGLDLVYRREITLKQALCGFSFDVKHLSGKSYRINNSRGNVVSMSSRKTIGGLGFTREGHTGSLLIEFSVIMPTTLSDEQIASLEKIL